jgi:CheY-like chemotaxis protein
MRAKLPVVLLLAADSLTQRTTTSCLETFGYEVISASDGAEAVSMLSSDHRIGVVVTDADIRGDVDGLAVATAARDLNPKIFVIYTARLPHAIPERRKVRGAPSLRTPYPGHQIVSVIGELRTYKPSERLSAEAA